MYVILSLYCPLTSSETPFSFVQYFCLNSAGVLKEIEEDDDGGEPTSGFESGVEGAFESGVESAFESAFELVEIVGISMPSLFGFWFNIAMTTMSAMMPAIR